MKRALLTPLLVAAACVPVYEPPDHTPIDPPADVEVEAVLFLVGDAGDAIESESPLVHKLKEEVEAWGAALDRDSAVTVAFLGDNVYPSGIHDPGTAEHATDSAHLWAQVSALSGDGARSGKAFGVFVPGNHDWGNISGQAGVDRLRNQELMLRSLARDTIPVSLLPANGRFGPAVLETTSAYRLVLLDTQWWLQEDDPGAKREALSALRPALRSPDGRPVVVLAHHPFATGGPHSGAAAGFDPLWLLRRTGSVVQDLNAVPFRDLVDGLTESFEAEGAPFVYAAGHDHSLQVLEGQGAGAPDWVLVSGAGSKLTPVGETEGLRWAARQPGYMRLMFLRDGRVLLFALGAPESSLKCPEGPAQDECMRRGQEAFEVVYSARLR